MIDEHGTDDLEDTQSVETMDDDLQSQSVNSRHYLQWDLSFLPTKRLF